MDPDHHNEDSPLEKLNVDMVNNFVIDPMHVVYLRVVKNLCTAWQRGKPHIVRKWVKNKKGGGKYVYVESKKRGRKREGKLTAGAIKALDRALENISASWPDEFSRRLRVFFEHEAWKAVEGRAFVLYVAPVILAGVLGTKQYNHFLLLHCALRILVSPELMKTKLEVARDLLMKFVKRCKAIYSKAFTVYTIHCLLHLVDEVEKFGGLESFGAFRFENHQRHIRKLIRGTRAPLQQLWYRLKERELLVTEDVMVSGIVTGRRVDPPSGPDCGLDGDHYADVRLNGSLLNLKKNNRYIVLENKSIVRCENFVDTPSGLFIIGREYTTYTDAYKTPTITSRDVGISVVRGLSAQHLPYSIDRVSGKALVFTHSGKTYAMELLHTV